MSYLIKQVTIIDKESPFHQKKVDVFYKNGVIHSIGKNLSEKAKVTIEANGKYVSKAWTDTFADFASPGFEHRESITAGAAAAANNGFGNVMIAPNNNPATYTASEIAYLIKEISKVPINIFPIGAVSKRIEGNDLAEMLDMKESGAIAFSDGWSPIQNDQLMFKALEYLKGIDNILIQIPIHNDLDGGGLMNEGVHSVALGIMGAPDIAEEIIIHRDITLVKYTGSKLHISGVSTQKGLELIKKAKKEGVQVTCSVTPYHLLFTDEKLSSYNSLYKVYPTLRTQQDVNALKEGLKSGIIDCIATHHKPHDWDEKVKELEYAKSGMAVLDIAWPMLLQANIKMDVEQWITVLVDNPATIFGINSPSIDAGAVVQLTLFDVDTKWTVDAKSKKSKAYNVPLLGQELIGKASVLV